MIEWVLGNSEVAKGVSEGTKELTHYGTHTNYGTKTINQILFAAELSTQAY